jgi:very-short-patch-repair endonuclease
MIDQSALADLLRQQHNVITWRQARQHGLNKDAIYRRIRPSGRWQRLLPGVYLAVTGTPTNDQRDTAALLYAGPGGTLTGPAALRRYSIRAPHTGKVDVLVPAKRVRQSVGFVVIHQTRRLPAHVCHAGPVQYALPARAVADAVRELGDLAAVRSVVAAAVQTGRCTVEQLKTELSSGPIHGSAYFRSALAEVIQGARSAPEAELLRLIRHARLPEPAFNPRLYIGTEFLARPDVWWQDQAVTVEVDSKEWHLSPDSWERTMRRHARMSAVGISVLHFTPRQIREEPTEVIATIRLALHNRRGVSVPPIRTVCAT